MALSLLLRGGSGPSDQHTKLDNARPELSMRRIRMVCSHRQRTAAGIRCFLPQTYLLAVGRLPRRVVGWGEHSPPKRGCECECEAGCAAEAGTARARPAGQARGERGAIEAIPS